MQFFAIDFCWWKYNPTASVIKCWHKNQINFSFLHSVKSTIIWYFWIELDPEEHKILLWLLTRVGSYWPFLMHLWNILIKFLQWLMSNSGINGLAGGHKTKITFFHLIIACNEMRLVSSVHPHVWVKFALSLVTY